MSEQFPRCPGCNKPNKPHENYCSWECIVEVARREGGQTIAPNGLPITCVNADGTMMEHEHADERDYKFPVVAAYTGPDLELPDWDPSCLPETHALLFRGEREALTLYECEYHLWSIDSGELLIKSVGGEWSLTEDSLAQIRALPVVEASDEKVTFSIEGRAVVAEVVYVTTSVVVTKTNQDYAIWSFNDGACVHGSLRGTAMLTTLSVDQVRSLRP